mmetsp:Transcript_59264/g.63980  ORF Transcript_59264/g.63980 Transcript_59264/m.63980 type:complete len:98 (+) Transcript_59264:3-296(+)
MIMVMMIIIIILIVLMMRKRNSVISAITGSAVVRIHDESMHSNCGINSILGIDDEWYDTIMVVVDGITFIKRPDFEILYKVLNTNCDAPSTSIFENQ